LFGIAYLLLYACACSVLAGIEPEPFAAAPDEKLFSSPYSNNSFLLYVDLWFVEPLLSALAWSSRASLLGPSPVFDGPSLVDALNPLTWLAY
jgi:hypothetical protein